MPSGRCGDPAVPVQPGRLVAGPGEGVERHGHVHRGGPAVAGGQSLPVGVLGAAAVQAAGGQRRPAEGGGDVEAQLVQGARIVVGPGGAGGGVQSGPEGGQVLGRAGQAHDAGGVGVTVRAGALHAPLLAALQAAGLGRVRVGGDDQPVQAARQLPQGPGTGGGQYPGLHPLAGGRVQHAGLRRDQLGAPLVDGAGVERLQGGGEILDELDRERDPDVGVTGCPGQRRGRFRPLRRAPGHECAAATQRRRVRRRTHSSPGRSAPPSSAAAAPAGARSAAPRRARHR